MPLQSETFFAASVALMLAVSPALANEDKHKGHEVRAVPAPIAGAGLGFVVLTAGGYALYRIPPLA
jgi:hypothetical protein